MKTALVVHGHFYQPPRENPWTGEIEREPGAEPHHDWNERIFAECYRPNGHARILDGLGRIERIVNNYSHISFNFGPTLLSWMERHHPLSYGRILDADQESAAHHGGHGNAIAQAYNHAILPLANERDRITQVRWGLEDFRHRFRREAEGMWLPEAACNPDTLETLIAEGVRFTILSPYQAARVRRIGDGEWRDARHGKLDASHAYRFLHRDGSGRSIGVFFYDGPRSRAIAFEGALSTSQGFLKNLAAGAHGTFVSVATDGESYGHHFKWGDRSLAHALEYEAKAKHLWVTNFAELLERHPPEWQVEIDLGQDGLGSSWSCAHGVGRWYRDCGCSTGSREGWNQAWRTPLRDALDQLRGHLAEAFERRASEHMQDPWAARSEYVRVILGAESPDEFMRRHRRRPLGPREEITVWTLLELQRHAMLMYTSCGWFFSDVSGIETLQIMKYAARAMDLLSNLGEPDRKDAFLARLADAKSNHPEQGTGAEIFRRTVEASRVSPSRIAAHLAMTSLVDSSEDQGEIATHAFERRDYKRKQHGLIALTTAMLSLRDTGTGAEREMAVAAIHLGGVDFYAVVRESMDPGAFAAASERLWGSFYSASLPALLRVASQELGPEEYGLEHLLPGGKERVSETIFGGLVRRFSEQYALLYEDNQRTLDMLQLAGFELPRELRAAAEFTLGRRFEHEIEEQRESQDAEAYKRAIEIAEAVTQHGYHIDRTASSRTFSHMITHSIHVSLSQRNREAMRAALDLLALSRRLRLELQVERAQEAVYQAAHRPEAFPRHEIEELVHALGISPRVLESA